MFGKSLEETMAWFYCFIPQGLKNTLRTSLCKFDQSKLHENIARSRLFYLVEYGHV